MQKTRGSKTPIKKLGNADIIARIIASDDQPYDLPSRFEKTSGCEKAIPCSAPSLEYNKGKYRKHEVAFRGLLTCAHDHCTVTAERKKGKYVYYRCTGYRGKCELPRFREEQIAERLGAILKNIYIPDEAAARIEQSLAHDQLRQKSLASAERTCLEQRLESVRRRIDQAYTDKLDGKISEDFWQRKMIEWQAEEQRIRMAVAGFQDSGSARVLDAKKTLELANKAYFLYLTRKPV